MSLTPYYEHGGITIYHGDCRDVLPHLPLASLVLTDPPYGIKAGDRRDGGLGSAPGGFKFYGRVKWDLERPDDDTIQQCVNAGTGAIVWGGNYFSLPPSSCWLVWDKGQRNFSLSDAELAWTNLNSAVRVFAYSRGQLTQEGKVHPTQKPLPLMKWCIQKHGRGGLIVDPFMGSGTTLRAAKDLGCSAIGVEAEEKYCEIAANRLSQEVLFA